MTKRQALAVLGLDNRATLKTIKKAYRALALLTHPDKGGDIEEFKVVANAYGLLVGRGRVTRPQPIRMPVQWVQVWGYEVSCGTGNTSAGTTGGFWY